MARMFVVLFILTACEEAAGPRAENGVMPIRAQGGDTVRIEMQKGSIRILPGSTELTVDGTIRTDDPTLLPHVTANARGVAVVQDFGSDAATQSTWELRLGSKPIRLDIHITASEDQHIDLGGRAVTKARYYNEGGHAQIDFSSPTSTTSSSWEIASIGYLEIRNIARVRAKRIELKNIGRADLSFGEPIREPLLLDVVASQGKLAIAIPTSMRAHITVPPSLTIAADGFTRDGNTLTSGPAEGIEATIQIANASGELTLTH